MPKKPRPHKYNPVVTSSDEKRTDALKASGFKPESLSLVKQIIKEAQIPGLPSKDITPDLADKVAAQLNEVMIVFAMSEHRNQAPTTKKTRGELLRLEKASKGYLAAVDGLSFPTKTLLRKPFNDMHLLESIRHHAFGLQEAVSIALHDLPSGDAGRRVKSTATTITMLADIYEGMSGRKAGAGKATGSTGKPQGPFLRFVTACYRYFSPGIEINPATLRDQIVRALKTRQQPTE